MPVLVSAGPLCYLSLNTQPQIVILLIIPDVELTGKVCFFAFLFKLSFL